MVAIERRAEPEVIELSLDAPSLTEIRLGEAHRTMSAFSGLRAENARLRAALIEMRGLWEITAAIPDAATRAEFITAHDPIGRIDAALGV